MPRDPRLFPWYRANIGPRLNPHARQLFENYVNLAPEEVETHILAVVGSPLF